MAIIKSVIIPNARKSAGGLTFAKVRGQQIMKEKISSNKSNTPAQFSQRKMFAFGEFLIKPWYGAIKNYIPKTKHGSEWNDTMRGAMQRLVGLKTYNGNNPSLLDAIMSIYNDELSDAVNQYLSGVGSATQYAVEASLSGQFPLEVKYSLQTGENESALFYKMDATLIGTEFNTVVVAVAGDSNSPYGSVRSVTVDTQTAVSGSGGNTAVIDVLFNNPFDTGGDAVNAQLVLAAAYYIDGNGKKVFVNLPSKTRP